jgi:hypothetical protein
MINFRGICPGCNRLSLVNLETSCPNLLNNCRVCGYTVTTSVASGNSLFRKKEDKHTNPPASAFKGEHSWTDPGHYDIHQAAALASGNLCYDPAKDYFCLSFPVASGEARVAYQSGTTQDAWHLNMPLNSRWPDLHLHYRRTSRASSRSRAATSCSLAPAS